MWLSRFVGRLIFAWVLAMTADGFAQAEIPPQISAMEASNYLNQQVVVVDRVVQLGLHSNVWFLHLNEKYPKAPLTSVIQKGFMTNFSNINIYLGQRVEMTGRITGYRGRWQLFLTGTNQIKILSETQPSAQPTPPAADAVMKTPLLASAPAPATALGSETPATLSSADHSSRAWGGIPELLAATVVLLAAGILILWQNQGNLARAPRFPRALAIPGEAANDSSAEAWKQRALAAEAMAGKQGELLREKILPELTEFAKQSLVQGLYAQRNVLLETQLQAQRALAELESRLSTLQTPLRERIRLYEQRIAELEREVETQGDEVRELTRATLTLVRRKLEDERQSERLQSRFN